MNRTSVRAFALAAVLGGLVATSALAQNPNPPPAKQQAREIQGQIVRTGDNQFVVKTRDNKEVIFYTNPQTRYLMNDKAVRYSDLRVGANVTAAYPVEGTRSVANHVGPAR